MSNGPDIEQATQVPAMHFLASGLQGGGGECPMCMRGLASIK